MTGTTIINLKKYTEKNMKSFYQEPKPVLYNEKLSQPYPLFTN